MLLFRKPQIGESGRALGTSNPSSIASVDGGSLRVRDSRIAGRAVQGFCRAGRPCQCIIYPQPLLLDHIPAIRNSRSSGLEEEHFAVYEYVPRQQIIEVLRHIRDLLRRTEPTDERERLAAERREIVAKYIISNLPRTGPHPTLSTMMELIDTFLLTIGAAHELFGYDLDAIRQYDLGWNSGRTHIVESYVFERDQLLDFPLELAPEGVFQADAMLGDLVREWQSAVPIRALDERSPGGPDPFTSI